MLTKILFTIAVIAVVVLLTKASHRSQPVRRGPGVSATSGYRWIKALAISVIAMMLVAFTVFLYVEWQSANELVMVRVIDTRSGRTAEYTVKRGKLEDRAFQAHDGRYVRLAETERMEIGAAH